MEKKTEKERKQRQYKRQNDYITANYERQTITLPKGVKNRIRAAGLTVNGLCNDLIKKYLDDNNL
jgi:hypothetical protein